MKCLLGSTGAALFALYFFTQADSLRTRSEQDAIALGNAHRRLEQAQAQLVEKNRQLESIQAALEAATAQPPQPPSALSKPSDSVQSSTDFLSSVPSPFIKNIFDLAQKAADLDRHFKGFPELEIPEVALLTESDWISIASQHLKLNTADQIRAALQHVCAVAESKALLHFQAALWRSPDLTALNRIEPLLPELRKKLPEDVIKRYELIPWAQLEANAPQRKNFTKEEKDKPLLVIRPKTISGELREGITISSDDGKSITSIMSPGIITAEEKP